VAFAISRAVGGAVSRNRLRRRLRPLLAASDLPAGWYLVGAQPEAVRLAAAPFAAAVAALVSRVTEAAR
jgi:ribonuclease P protein component